MEKNKIMPIIVIIVIAVIAIVAIVLLNNTSKENNGLNYYVATINKDFDNKLIKNYSDFRKFTRELSITEMKKNYQNYDALEVFNEEYFNTNKVAVLGITEDNASNYVYEINSVDYNEDKTKVTINYTLDVSGYNGSVTSSWINCFIIEVEGTVTSVEFVNSEMD